MKDDLHTGTPRFRLRFLAPNFWGTWLKSFVLWLAMFLPRRWLMTVGAFVGDRVRIHNHKRRRIAEINLALCFPALSAAQRHQMLVEHFQYYGRGLMDLALTLWGSKARLNRVCEFERCEWLKNLSRQQPVIVVTFHTTTVEISGSLLGQTRPTASMMKRVSNPLFNWQLWRGRIHHDRGNALIMRDEGIRPLVRLVKAGHICYFAPDEDFGDAKHSVFASFFGVQTARLTVVSRLAKLTGALVVPSVTRLDADTGKYVMSLSDPLENFPSDDAQADTVALNAVMENLIQREPAQYMWTFRWFKTRADGAPNPYEPPQ